MNKKVLQGLVIVAALYGVRGQTIGMNFPQFAGKSYDFIIFQGNESKTVYKGTIPKEGKFTLTVPKEYAPYNGMSRWLITGTAEGGGLDMYIPAKNFSVSCTEAVPTEKNIVYTGNNGNTELDLIDRKQQDILSRYEAMKQAVNAFSADDSNYPVFQKEYRDQINAYNNFHRELAGRSDYISRFLQIVNITRGLGLGLFADKKETANDVYHYITDAVDWNTLYTSGHWTTVINAWLGVHTLQIKDPAQFALDFRKVSNKISSPVVYTGFAERVAYYLSNGGYDGYIAAIAPEVTGSGKISAYKGVLDLYIKGVIGSEAPDLVFQGKDGKKQVLKIADSGYKQTLLFFYQSTDCDTCDQQLKQLSDNYPKLLSRGIRIITISSDKEESVYISKSKSFPWKDTYCDYCGVEGENYRNYGITGVPTLVLTDSSGKILSRGASINF